MSIRVVDEDGDAVSGASVTVHFSLLSGFSEEYTDSDGWAEFSNEYESEGKDLWIDTIYIDSDEVGGKFYASDGDTYSFTKTY